MSERIAKYLSRAGLCSRRDAERWIAAGRVAVNGKTIDTPVILVSEADEIQVDGNYVSEKAPPQLWLYHKPAGLITSHTDPQGRPTVFDHLPAHLPRVISVGRLDLSSEGLLLLTNDGELARYMEHPDTGWSRKYRVRMRGTPNAETLRALKKGVTIEDITYRGIGVKLEEGKTGQNIWAEVTLTEGKNREIRRVFEHFNHPVSRLIRIAYGPFQLGKLEPGEVKRVSHEALKNAVGKKFTL